jgi:DNA polymerase-3 subunit beta
MQFKVKKGDFLAALYWTQSIVERRHTMPILANVLIESHKGEVRVTATDLEVGIRGEVKGEIVTEGEITVNARKLYEIVREAPDEMVQLKRLENDWVEIKSGKSVFKMVGISAKEFPQFPQFPTEKLIPVPIRILREMIEKTIFSVSNDETRHNLNGVLVEEGEKGIVRMVATDGHRLALIERSIGSMGLEKGVIIPRKGLAELKKLLEESEEGVVSIGFQDNMGLVTKDNLQLFMRLIDEDFPDYSKVVPKDNPYGMKVAKDGFLQALRRVSILSSERYKGVKIELKEGAMAISANNPDLGEAVEEMEVEYKGRLLSLGFNARYLLDVLGVLGNGGEIDIKVKDEVSPGLVTIEGDENYLYVVMPMRL